MKNIINNTIKVTATMVEYSSDTPWFPTISQGTGTAFIVNYNDKKFIMTCAHVASSNACDIYGKFANSHKTHNLKVVYTIPFWDISILEPQNTDFWSNHQCHGLVLAQDAKISSKIFVYGFPLFSENVICTNGIIAGFKDIPCAYTSNLTKIFSMNISAIINQGSSGGPVVNKDGAIVGISNQMTTGSNIQSQSYAVPLLIIKTTLHKYLNDLSPHIPNGGFYYQLLSQSSLKQYIQLPENISGCRVTKISKYSNYYPQIQEGDILYNVDGHIISDDGQVLIDNYLAPFTLLWKLKSVGESLNITLYRNNQQIQTKIVICEKSSETLLVGTKTREDMPTYLVYNGLLITPAVNDACSPELQISTLGFLTNMRSLKNLEAVMIRRVLFSKHTRDLNNLTDSKIVAVNGQKIRCIWDVIEILEQNHENYAFKMENNSIICIPRMTAEDQALLAKDHNINKFKSDDLLPANKAQYLAKFPTKLQLAAGINNINTMVNIPMVQFSAPVAASILGMADNAAAKQRDNMNASLYDDIIHQAANHCVIC
jgi:S1-C subfamily serine protease